MVVTATVSTPGTRVRIGAWSRSGAGAASARATSSTQALMDTTSMRGLVLHDKRREAGAGKRLAVADGEHRPPVGARIERLTRRKLRGRRRDAALPIHDGVVLGPRFELVAPAPCTVVHSNRFGTPPTVSRIGEMCSITGGAGSACTGWAGAWACSACVEQAMKKAARAAAAMGFMGSSLACSQRDVAVLLRGVLVALVVERRQRRDQLRRASCRGWMTSST